MGQPQPNTHFSTQVIVTHGESRNRFGTEMMNYGLTETTDRLCINTSPKRPCLCLPTPSEGHEEGLRAPRQKEGGVRAVPGSCRSQGRLQRAPGTVGLQLLLPGTSTHHLPTGRHFGDRHM